jgi:hypothetical protein
MIALIRETVSQFGQNYELIIAGDFNRHDQLWGSDEVGASARQGEATELMMDLNLQSLLPRGTKTYELSNAESTIDLLLSTPVLTEDRICCRIQDKEYGSDHLAVNATFCHRDGPDHRPTTHQALRERQLESYQAWRNKQVLSLVSFDVKGAYDGVNKNVLLR